MSMPIVKCKECGGGIACNEDFCSHCGVESWWPEYARQEEVMALHSIRIDEERKTRNLYAWLVVLSVLVLLGFITF